MARASPSSPEAEPPLLESPYENNGDDISEEEIELNFDTTTSTNVSPPNTHDRTNPQSTRASKTTSSSLSITTQIPSTFTEKWDNGHTQHDEDEEEEDNAPLLPPTSLNEDEKGIENDENTDDIAAQEEAKQAKDRTKAEYKTALMNFGRIFTYATTTDKLCLCAAVLASVLTGVTLPLMNVVFGQLVGAFNDFYKPDSGADEEAFLGAINQNVLYIIYLFLGRLVLDYISIICFRMVSIRISASIRLTYLQSLFSLPISTLDTLPPGQTAAIITTTASTLQTGISERLSLLFHSISLIITALVISIHYSLKLTLVTGSGLLFIVVFYACTLPRLVRGLKGVEQADLGASAVASEVFGAVRMVAACGAEGKMVKRYREWVETSRERGLGMNSLVAMQQAPVFFAIHATFALSFWYAVKLYLEQSITRVTSMIVVLTSIMSIVMSLGSISAPISAAAQAAGAAGIFFSIIDAPSSTTHGVKPPEVSSQQDIVLENVNFAYPIRHDVKVLNNLNISFPAGKQTAIVGPSGSGKSTIVGLLERWYELDGNMTTNISTLYFRSGTITVGGKNLHETDLRWWRSQIGLVQQEPFLFNDTIYKNVEYGLIGTQWENASRQQKKKLIKRACVEAFADEFIARLPKGYNTSIGDAGIKLSGGQRQRIAIARSIVKQPKILILDEATSAVDITGEKIVQAALDKVSKNRTTITIAHRLSTIMKADNIVVLQKGQVAQQGTHAELLKDKAGPYWGLVSAQQLSLGDEVAESSSSASSDLIEESELKQKRFRSIDLTEGEKISEKLEYQNKTLLGSFQLFLWEQKHQWEWYGLMLFGALGAGASFPLHALLFARLISLFNLSGDYLESQTNFWCFMFFLLACGVGITYFALGWSSNTVSFNITAHYRNEYFENILSKPISYFDKEENSIGSLTARMATDPTQLQQLLGINMAIVLISVFNIIGCVGMSFYFGWKLTLLTIFSALPIILAAGFFRIRYEIQFEKMNNEVFKESAKFATESIGAFRTVSSLTLEPEICSRYANLLHNHTRDAFEKAKFSTLIFAMSDSISLLCMAFVMWYGGQLLASREYSPFNYLVIYLAIVQGSTSAGQSLSFGPNVAQAFAAAKRIRGMRSKSRHNRAVLFDLENLDGDEKGQRGVKIELQNVNFKYPSRDVPVLQGLNMTIERGQFAAIVGPSGSGKTSIISLLERFYRVQFGKILYHGTNIEDISLSEYRSSISLVAQEPSLFEGTIRDNLLLGVDDIEGVDELRVHQVCRDAEIHDFITSLPEGYNTAVGARGVALSGGQKQRIAIARALIRNPRVLLLDEATSNLDSVTERLVQAVFEKTAEGRTMIVVAHRLATVQNADIIFVMGDGRIVESGDHSTLLRMKGLYYQMCQSQALNG